MSEIQFFHYSWSPIANQVHLRRRPLFPVARDSIWWNNSEAEQVTGIRSPMAIPGSILSAASPSSRTYSSHCRGPQASGSRPSAGLYNSRQRSSAYGRSSVQRPVFQSGLGAKLDTCAQWRSTQCHRRSEGAGSREPGVWILTQTNQDQTVSLAAL